MKISLIYQHQFHKYLFCQSCYKRHKKLNIGTISMVLWFVSISYKISCPVVYQLGYNRHCICYIFYICVERFRYFYVYYIFISSSHFPFFMITEHMLYNLLCPFFHPWFFVSYNFKKLWYIWTLSSLWNYEFEVAQVLCRYITWCFSLVVDAQHKYDCERIFF